MELYKDRSFGDMFQDTFSFLKKEGKHFFKHYFIINGIFLLILSVLGYFFSRFYSDFIRSLASSGGTSANFETYLNENGVFLTLLIVVFLILAVIASVVTFAFPPLYFNIYLKKGSGNFDTSDIINAYKQNVGKLIMFVITGIVVAVLLMIPVGLISFILLVTMIGAILIPFVFGGIMLFYTMTFMEYLEGKKGVWESFGYSWTLLKSKFFPAIFSVGLFYLISNIILQVLIMIPYILGVFQVLTSPEQGNLNPEQISNMMFIMLLAIFFIGFIFGSVLGSIVQVNQGIIFYSLKEKNENIQTKSIIDQIGVSE